MNEDAASKISFEYITTNYAIFAAIPLVCGASFLFGYLLPLGRGSLLLASYQDIFKYSLISVPVSILAIMSIIYFEFVILKLRKFSKIIDVEKTVNISGIITLILFAMYLISLVLFADSEWAFDHSLSVVIIAAVLIQVYLSRTVSRHMLIFSVRGICEFRFWGHSWIQKPLFSIIFHYILLQRELSEGEYLFNSFKLYDYVTL